MFNYFVIHGCALNFHEEIKTLRIGYSVEKIDFGKYDICGLDIKNSSSYYFGKQICKLVTMCDVYVIMYW